MASGRPYLERLFASHKSNASSQRPSSSHTPLPGPAYGSQLPMSISTEDDPEERQGLVSSPLDPSEDDLSPILDHDPWGHEQTRSTGYLLLVTTAMFGLQVAWSVELASASPFLLSLGLSKSLLALVWIAGPLSGTLVQPYVGIRSDNSRMPWGRRRPFMVGGTIVTIISLLALCWTREIVAGFLGIFGIRLASDSQSPAFQVWAVTIIYVLDFAINVMQAATRAFMVDCAPTHQQEAVNAWASRVSGAGHILAYALGFVDLPNLLPVLGNSQFKVFVALACLLMIITMSISCLSIQERDPSTLPDPIERGAGVVSFFRALYRSMRKLPPQVRKVCIVQIWAWIGWFPFLFYTTTYVGGLYAERFFVENPNLSEQEIDEILERGTREGSFALFVFAVMTFAAAVLLPQLIPPTYQPLASATRSTLLRRHPSTGTSFSKPSSHTFSRLSRILDPANLQIQRLTLCRAWLFSHLAFAALMFLTFFVSSATTATVLIGLVGIPWTLTNWAPYALIAAEISRRDAERRGNPASRPAPLPLSTGPRGMYSQTGMGSSQDLGSFSHPYPTSPHMAEPLDPGLHATADLHDASADQAGVLLGIHNVAIAAPQIIATLVSSVIFRLLQKPRGVPGDDSVGWVLRFGGLCALVAAWTCRNVEENARRQA